MSINQNESKLIDYDDGYGGSGGVYNDETLD